MRHRDIMRTRARICTPSKSGARAPALEPAEQACPSERGMAGRSGEVAKNRRVLAPAGVGTAEHTGTV